MHTNKSNIINENKLIFSKTNNRKNIVKRRSLSGGSQLGSCLPCVALLGCCVPRNC